MTKLEALQAVQAVNLRLFVMNQQLDVLELKQQGDGDTMISPSEQKLIDGFNTATTAIANRIAALVASQAAQGMSPEAQAAFQTEIDNLTKMGSDPNNPTGTI